MGLGKYKPGQRELTGVGIDTPGGPVWLYKAALIACLVLIVGVAIFVDMLNSRYEQLNQRDAVRRDLSVVVARLESSIMGDIQAARALIAAVRLNPELEKTQMDHYAAPLLEGENNLRSLAVSRDYRLDYVYPLKGNEAALGLDFRDHPKQLAGLQRALQSGQPQLVGPINLVQGGQAIIIRLPVASRPTAGGANYAVSAVIDIDSLIRDTLGDSHGVRLDVAIRTFDSSEGTSASIAGKMSLFDPASNPVFSQVSLPYSQPWQLAATPAGGWPAEALFTPFRLGLLAASLFIFGGIFAISWLIQRRQESNQLLERLFELSPIGIVLNEFSSGQFISANSAMRERLGYSSAEFAHLSYQQITPPDFDESDKRFIATLHRDGRMGPYRKSLIRRDGSLMPVVINSILFNDSRGRQLIWSMIEDISDSQRAEQAMARQQEMLESMSVQARIGAWEYDVASGEWRWSEMIKEICGVSDEFEPDLVSTQDFYTNDAMRDDFRRGIRRAIKYGEAFSKELKIHTQDGRSLWVRVIGNPDMEEGRCLRIHGSFQDIDEQKRAAEALIKARDDAEQAARIKSEFLATMSHEIRTPMNGVLGMLNLLDNSRLDFEQERRVSIARSSARSLLSLIDDVLDFSRIDAGKMTLESQPFKLRELIEEVCESMSLRSQEKGLELIIDVSHIEVDTVVGDSARLRQVLTNLLGNALKFTEKGEVIVAASLHNNGRNWQLNCHVRDTGIGISAEKQDQLFTAFTQADASTTRRYGGSGLGLSISQKICEAMGGKITVTSLPGEGSDFCVTLPLEKSPDAETDGQPAAGKRIWLVEDNQSTRESLRRQLQRWGAEVMCSTSSEQALSQAESGSDQIANIDLVIIDRYMEGLDGTELVQFLRQEPLLSQLPIVLLCNIASEGTETHFRSLGFDAWYPKPITTANLREMLALDPMTASPMNARPLQRDTTYDSEQLSGRRVLLVEDNAVNQEVVRCLLDELGLQVTVAGDGEIALRLLKQQQNDDSPPFSAILMDCQMPHMDGYDCTRHIRAGLAGEAARQLPIIALTANALSGDREKCSAAGMDDYLSKPIEPERLQSKLMNWIAPTAHERCPALEDGTCPEQRWNAAKALESVMGQEKTLNKLLLMFNDYSREQQSALRAAVTQANIEDIVRITHALKGSSGQLQGTALRDAAAALELAASENNWEKIHFLYPQLQQQWQLLCECFERHLSRHASPIRQQMNS